MALAQTESGTDQVWISSPSDRTIMVYDNVGQLAFLVALPKQLAHPSRMLQHGVLMWVAAASHVVIYDATTGQSLGSWQAHKVRHFSVCIYVVCHQCIIPCTLFTILSSF